jgi:prepilin-type N-terminal cleavage/methylation domain-containing protein
VIKKSGGFTLVELLIVIAVLGILVTVGIVVLNPVAQLQKSRDAARKATLRDVQNALEQYYTDNGVYPNPNVYASGTCFSAASWNCWNTNPASSMFGPNASTYIQTMSQDPSFVDQGGACNPGDTTTRGYAYYTADGQSYILVTRLENASDPSIQPGGANYYDGTGGGCTKFGNYKVESQQ